MSEPLESPDLRDPYIHLIRCMTLGDAVDLLRAVCVHRHQLLR